MSTPEELRDEALNEMADDEAADRREQRILELENATMRTVRLDWASEADPSGNEAARQYMLSYARVVGSANGWPIVEFFGSFEGIDRLVREYSHDLEDVDGDHFFYDIPQEPLGPTDV